MATAVDFWNEVDRRITARLGDPSGMAGTESADGTSAPPPAAGGLPIHNNAHHEPPLALQSDLESLTFLDLLDTPATYAGSPLFLLRVNAGATAVEFADGSLLYDSAGAAAAAVAAHVAALDPHTQYYNEARGDARYALIGHLQAVTAGGTGLTGIAADNLIYSSALNTFSATPITAFGRGLIDDANAAAARTTLELVAGGLGDIWVEKAGDTMTGALVISVAGTGLTVDNDARVSGRLGVGAAASATHRLLVYDSGVPLPSLSIQDGDITLPDYSGSGIVPLPSTNEIGRATGASSTDGGMQIFGFSDTTAGGLALVLTGLLGSNSPTGAGVVLRAIKHDNSTGLAALLSSEIVLEVRNFTTTLATMLGNGHLGLGIVPAQRLDIAETTGAVLRLRRSDTGIDSGDMIGRVEFYGADSDLSTQNIFANIEAQAAQSIGGNAAAGNLLFRTTGTGAGGSPVTRLTLTHDGRLYGSALHNNAGAVTGTTDQYVASGTYTPTLTHVLNIAASTAFKCNWLRVGNVVTVSGKVNIDPTAATTSTQIGISLPIASNLAANEDCSGVAYSSNIAQGAAILGDAANNRAQLQYLNGADVANQPFYFHFTYEVL